MSLLLKFYYLIVLIYQIVSETKDQTEREFGSRLGRSIVASSIASLLSAKRARLEERQRSNIPVEKTVIENNLKFGEREIQMMKSVKQVLFASSVSTTNSISVVVGEMRMSMSELEEQYMRFCKNLLYMTNTTPSMAMSMIISNPCFSTRLRSMPLMKVILPKSVNFRIS